MAGIPQKHDPGGKVRLALSPDVKSSPPVFGGPGDCYRYTLDRTWDETKPRAMFIMMNPSMANEKWDDRSVSKCQRFARRWGVYGGISVGNTFAYCATDQKKLAKVSEPVGPENDAQILKMAREAAVVIFAYGKPHHRHLRSRGREVAAMLVKNGIQPHFLKLSKDGTPWHPLYLSKTLKPRPWKL
jgi:hypothetical protein